MNLKHAISNRQRHPSTSSGSAHQKSNPTSEQRDTASRALASCSQRVVQPNMLYVIGLPPSLANEQLLRQHEYCGQYGSITRVLVKDSTSNGYGSYSVYVTYENESEASLAMLALNNFFYGKYRMYASYGTNKYCSTYVRTGRCRKEDCLFLHKIDPTREVRQEDNKKHFQDQQLSAAKLLASELSQQHYSTNPQAVFPDKRSVYQWLLAEGFIILSENAQHSKNSNPLSDRPDTRSEGGTPRLSYHLPSIKLTSQNSTECSPKRESSMSNQDIVLDEDESQHIIRRILNRVVRNKGSVLGFGNQTEQSDMDKQETSRLSSHFRQLVKY